MFDCERKPIVIGVLALQGAFKEHIASLERLKDTFHYENVDAFEGIDLYGKKSNRSTGIELSFREVRTKEDLFKNNKGEDFTQLKKEEGTFGIHDSSEYIDGLILPGGESTAISIIGERDGILDTIRDMYMGPSSIPIWGTCAGMILLCNHIMMAKQGGQAILGGLEALVCRNYFGSQVASAILPIAITEKMGSFSYQEHRKDDGTYLHDNVKLLSESTLPKPSVFIRAPAILHVEDPTIDILATVQANPSSTTRSNMIKYLDTYDGKTYLPFSQSIDALGRETQKKYDVKNVQINTKEEEKVPTISLLSLTPSSSTSSMTTNSTNVSSTNSTIVEDEALEEDKSKTNIAQLPDYLSSLLEDLKDIEKRESLSSSYLIPNSKMEQKPETAKQFKPMEPIVAIRRENILATAFHPELTDDLYWHEYFFRMVIKSAGFSKSN